MVHVICARHERHMQTAQYISMGWTHVIPFQSSHELEISLAHTGVTVQCL